MHVVKRDGSSEPMQFDKITKRIKSVSFGLSDKLSPDFIAQKVISGIYDGVKTTELDTLAAEIAATNVLKHPDYGMLAGRIEASNLRKNIEQFRGNRELKFSECIEDLANTTDEKGENNTVLDAAFIKFVSDNAARLDAMISHDADFTFDFFGIKTLTRSYLLKINKVVRETPQFMYLRVAIGIHFRSKRVMSHEQLLTLINQTYYDMAVRKIYTHATPTLFNAGTAKPQMSSCFLLTVKEDSVSGIYDTLKDCALISQSAGGIGVAFSNVRGSGSYIKGTNGNSNGIIPFMKVFNETARAIDQGGGKRKGAFAVYIEPWHTDIFEMLDLKKNTGKEELRARDLFYALWIPDLFMQRVKAKGKWTLLDPNECKGLQDCYGEEFNKLYESYEAKGYGKTIDAQDLWFKILESQIETGSPYMLYKDAANNKSNQKNLGTIKSSNLCTEILEYTAPDEVAVCNLASIALNAFVDENGIFDFDKLYDATYKVTVNLNDVIDCNYYPVPEAEYSNKRHRPIGLGVQGLADVFAMKMLPFDSAEARKLNDDIFETMYYAALSASNDIAKEYGAYETFEGSPASKGQLQFDLWNLTSDVHTKNRYDWDLLKRLIIQYGIRNSLLLAPMPTASTAQILGNNECFEPFTSNVYTRRVLSGEFMVVNKHLMNDLIDLDLWNDDMKNALLSANGSIQDLDVPFALKQVYKTVWELSQKTLLTMSADRGKYICQSQSLNVFIANPNYAKLSSMHFYGWELGLKTGMYYLRTKPAVDAIKFTVEQQQTVISKDEAMSGIACSIDNPDACEACGS